MASGLAEVMTSGCGRRRHTGNHMSFGSEQTKPKSVIFNIGTPSGCPLESSSGETGLSDKF